MKEYRVARLQANRFFSTAVPAGYKSRVQRGTDTLFLEATVEEAGVVEGIRAGGGLFFTGGGRIPLQPDKKVMPVANATAPQRTANLLNILNASPSCELFRYLPYSGLIGGGKQQTGDKNHIFLTIGG